MSAWNTGLLVLFAATGTLSAALISTSVTFGSGPPVLRSGCSGNWPGSPHAECFAINVSHGLERYNTAQADVFTTATSDIVSARSDLYRFLPVDLSARADYQNDFEVTFFGGSGFGVFTPCFSATGWGAYARAVATLSDPPVAIPIFTPGRPSVSVTNRLGPVSTNCNGVADPGNGLFFVFGQPVKFSIELSAIAGSDNPFFAGIVGGAQAGFLHSFNVSQVLVDDPRRIQPLPTATWDLIDLSLPEPGTGGLLAFGVAGLFLARHSRTHRPKPGR